MCCSKFLKDCFTSYWNVVICSLIRLRVTAYKWPIYSFPYSKVLHVFCACFHSINNLLQARGLLIVFTPNLLSFFCFCLFLAPFLPLFSLTSRPLDPIRPFPMTADGVSALPFQSIHLRGQRRRRFLYLLSPCPIESHLLSISSLLCFYPKIDHYYSTISSGCKL